MGDIGGATQAAASMVDTGMNDATQMAMQQISNNFNAEQAGLTRSFDASQQSNAQNFSKQEQLQAEAYNTSMSNTQMQRRVADLKAAGINPLLAAGSLGGASSPTMSAPGSPALGGPAASSVGLPSTQPLMSGLMNLANIRKTNADTDVSKVVAATKTAELPWAGASAEAGYNNLVATREQLMADVRNLAASAQYSENNNTLLLQNTDYQKQLQPLLVRAAELENQAKQYGMPSLATQSNFWSSPLAGAVYAGQQGHAVGGDIGGALATAAWSLYKGTSDPMKGPTGYKNFPLAPHGIPNPDTVGGMNDRDNAGVY